MADFLKKYQQWLHDFTQTLNQLEQKQLQNMIKLGEQLEAFIKASKDLSAYETSLFVETLKRQWQEHAKQTDDKEQVPSLWPEALWQTLSSVTDKSQLEWQELSQDFKHQGVYFQGETVGMGRYRCSHCLQHLDYTHPGELLRCSQCGGVTFFREGLPV